MSRHPDREDLVAYAIGGLEPPDENTVAAHVEDCEACTRELAGYAPAVSALAEGVDPVPPPPELRERLLAIVHEEAAPDFAPEPKRRSRSAFLGFMLRPATGLAAAAVVAAGVGGFTAAGDDGKPARTVDIANTAGDAGGKLVFADGEATLEMTGMPQLSKGAVYQVWVADSRGVKPSATFLPHEDGTATAAIPEASNDVSQIMVTSEPGPNRTSPTAPPVLDVKLD